MWMPQNHLNKLGRIFISYRRGDTAGYAGRIHDRLAQAFGPSLLFMDVDSIGLGIDFVSEIQKQVSKCGVLIAIIGPNWLDVTDESANRRLDNPNDFVRIEIAAALQGGILVIPIFIDGAEIPNASRLPDNLKELAKRQGFWVRHASFHNDMRDFIRRLKKLASASEDGEQNQPTERSEHLHVADRRTRINTSKANTVRVSKSEPAIETNAKKKKFSHEYIQAGTVTFFSLHLTTERTPIKPVTNLKQRYGLTKRDWGKLADQLSDLDWMKEIAVRLSADEIKGVHTPLGLTRLIWEKMDSLHRGYDTAMWSDL
jgi:hypothetical protein